MDIQFLVTGPNMLDTKTQFLSLQEQIEEKRYSACGTN